MPGVIFAFYVAKGGWRDKLIRWATSSRYSHVEIVTDAQLKPENWAIAASKRDGNRVREKLIKWTPEHWEFWHLPTDQAEQIIDRAVKHEGAPYDALGALLAVTPLNLHSSRGWFCFELAANAIGEMFPHMHTGNSLQRRLKELGAERITT